MPETFGLQEVDLHVDGEAGQRVDLESLSFHHAIAELYELSLVVIADHDLELDQRVGSDVRAVLVGLPEWSLPEVSGILWSARLLTLSDTGRARYALRIVPPAKLFTQRKDHRIFQGLTVPELIAAVFSTSARMPETAWQLVEAHPKCEFMVQYAETDLDFVKRIAADEGITVVHQPRAGGAPLLVDDTSRLDRAAALRVQCAYTSESWNHDGVARIREVELERKLRAAKVVVGDYDFQNPRYALGASADATVGARRGEEELEQYAFEVGRFAKDADGATRAKRLLEGKRVSACVLTGETSHPLAAGQIVEVQGHRRPAIDGLYLVIESTVTIRRNDSHVAKIRAIPFESSYRPVLLPKVRIAGTQTATVVGAPGETVDVDEKGRVEVAFHWDRRRPTGPGASRRVRVAQTWGGAGHGMFTVPRVGDEVVVAFVDGDPNEPLIVGQVHNGVRPTPLSLPESKTQAVWRSQSIGADGSVGFNHVLMDDAAGNERLELRSQRDFVVKTNRNENITVGSSSSRQVGGDESLTVGGTREVTVVGDERTEVKEFADYRANEMAFSVAYGLSAMSDTTTFITNERLDRTDGRHEIKTQELHVYSDDGMFAAAKKIHCMAPESFSLLVGAYSLFMDASGIALNGPGSTISLSADGISITSAGVVDIKGALIKLNS